MAKVKSPSKGRSRSTARSADDAPVRSTRRSRSVTDQVRTGPVTQVLPVGTDADTENPAKAKPAKIPPPVVVDHPGQSEAQIAAGPHRPEPATPLSHTPVGPVGPLPDVDATRAARSARIRVRAKADGYYGDARRRAGSLFDLTDAAAFAPSWMEHVTERAPAKSGQTENGQTEKASTRRAGAKKKSARK